MKTIVRHDEIREFEVKPSPLINTYLQLTQSDIKAYFADDSALLEANCPACLSSQRSKGFTKFGFQYWECAHCKTLYVSPRPRESAINQYYQSSQASKFWKEELSRTTEVKRREKVFKPRVEWIIETIEGHIPSARHFACINLSHYPFFLELVESNYFREITIINPRIELNQADYQKGRVRYIDKPIESISPDNAVDAVAIFEAIDRVSEVDSFFEAIRGILVPGGLCFLTTISVSGFDLQVLWETSNSIFPPDRINAFSIEGLKIMFQRHGFECLELSTPGLLDVEIVANAYRENPAMDLPRFVKYLLDKRDADSHQSFQEFLQMNQLSSYARAVLRKV